MAAKLTSCFSTGLHQRRRYSLGYACSKEDKLQKPNDFTDDTSENISDGNEISSMLGHAVSDEDIAEESDFTWTLVRKQAVDFSQQDFSMLKVGKHILQLPQLHSSSQDYRLNKVINNSGNQQENTQLQQHARGDTQQQQHARVNTQYRQLTQGNTQHIESVDNETGDFLIENVYI